MGMFDVKPSYDGVKIIEEDWLSDEKEIVLIYGPPKCGKTWAYSSIVEAKLKEDSNVYIINTDSGVSKTFKQYFDNNLDSIKGKTFYYFINDMNQIFKLIPEIKAKVKKNDVIIIDLISDFWNMAQARFMEECSGGNILGYFQRASVDNSKFGLFDGQKWQYIKKLEGYIVDELVTKAPCMIIGVASEKDIDVEKALTKQKKHLYDNMGAKPGGSPELAYRFNTVVYLNNNDGKRFFQIVGDRGAITNQQINYYNKNFWEEFIKVRQSFYNLNKKV